MLLKKPCPRRILIILIDPPAATRLRRYDYDFIDCLDCLAFIGRFFVRLLRKCSGAKECNKRRGGPESDNDETPRSRHYLRASGTQSIVVNQ